MARPSKTDPHLPPCVYLKHGAYWLVKRNKWERLGATLPEALAEYGGRVETRDAATRPRQTLALTADELHELTHEATAVGQCSTLDALGVAYKARPADGSLIVLRLHVEQAVASGTPREPRGRPALQLVQPARGAKRGASPPKLPDT